MIRTGDVVHLAEQATLGALLLQPAHLREVVGWVRGQDFADPWHRQVWVLMREAHTAGAPLDAIGLGGALRDRCGPQRADLPRVHDLLRAVPPKPDARPFARVVVEYGVRREIAAQGVLIEAAALAAATTHEGAPVHACARVVGAAMLVAGERWADASGQPTARASEHLPVQVRAAGDDLELRRAADKFLASHPGPDAAAARANEARLVACLVSHPTAIGPTHAWLPAERLGNRPWRTVYAALGELAQAGHDVDVVTLSAQILRTARRTGPAPDLRDLLDAVDAEVTSVPGRLRRYVAGDQLRRLAQAGTTALRDGAANPATGVTGLLGDTHVLLDSMRQLASALPETAGAGASSSHLRLVHRRDLDPPAAPGEFRDGPVAG